MQRTEKREDRIIIVIRERIIVLTQMILSV